MKRALPLAALALFSWACGGDGGSEPPVATTVTVAPAAVNFDALGATQVVHASVQDQKGRAMAGAALTWSSSAAAVTVSGLGGDSALVTSVANGNASVTATAGTASGAAAAQVAQVAMTLQKVGGDQQQAAPGAALGAQIRVRASDRLGAPVAGQTVTFAVTAGGGSLSSTSVVTGADGTAGTSWTLGPTAGAQQTVSASISGVTTPQLFNATASVTVPPGSVTISAGDNQGAMAGTALPARPTVLVKDASGNPAPGKTVTFAVTSGGGSVTGAVATTDANGVASVGSWTLGSSGPNTLTATVSGGGTFTNNPVAFRAIGCEGAGAGYAITLCFTSNMTSSQRAVFASAAARWAGVITGDLEDVEAQIPSGSCGETAPSLDLIIDDLVIFAGVEDIDGPGNVLGSAGPCYIRTGGLPVIGLMRFDLADVASLETSGTLAAVFLHEMGHVLGIGSFWASRGLVHNTVSGANGSALTDTYFSGVNGIAGFDAIGGTTYTGGAKVPVENTGGPGTQNSHWRENVLKNELMTGFLNAGSNPLSALTVRSLQDLGYTVNPGAADPFFLTLSIRGSITGTQGGLKLENDVYTGPVWSIDRRGRRTPLSR
jgi:hypothetical protein